MGLKKSVDLETGVSGEYWSVHKIDIDFDNKIASADVQLFINRAAKKAGKVALASKTLTWAAPNFPFKPSDMDVKNPITIAYDNIKLDPSFGDATDVIETPTP